MHLPGHVRSLMRFYDVYDTLCDMLCVCLYMCAYEAHAREYNIKENSKKVKDNMMDEGERKPKYTYFPIVQNDKTKKKNIT